MRRIERPDATQAVTPVGNPALERVRSGWNRGGVASLDTALRAYSG